MTRTLTTLITAAAIATAIVVWSPAPARAGCDENAAAESEGKFVIEHRNGKKVYVIKDAITVCGKVPRPSVLYVLKARSINYQWETLKQDFLPKIRDSVKKAPF